MCGILCLGVSLAACGKDEGRGPAPAESPRAASSAAPATSSVVASPARAAPSTTPSRPAASAPPLAGSAPTRAATAPVWDPKNTYAVVAGVLSWKDKDLPPFSKAGRKDQELFDTLAARGVPGGNRVLLLDDAATAKAFLSAVETLAARATKGSTLVLYYAGHGVKTNDDHVVFASTDIDTSELETTGLHVDDIGAVLLAKARGVRVLLLADCCYSGGLGDVAKKASAGGLEVLALTSSESSNTSTGNWTFTQTLIDGLRGSALFDHDGDGKVSLGELTVEAAAAMKFREEQRYGHANYGVDEALVVADAEKCDGCPKPELERPFARGSYVTAPHPKDPSAARVLSADAAKDALSLAFYDYNHYTKATVPRAGAKPITFPHYPVGAEIDVDWEGKTYDAKVLKVADDFAYITYPGFDSTWDEWVTGSRILGQHQTTRVSKKVKVKWKNTYYDAVVTKQQGNKTCVHYVGYGASSDECVTADRIR